MNAGVPGVKRCYKGRALRRARRSGTRGTRGFTVGLELVVVLAALALLDGLGVPGAIDGALHRRAVAMAAGRASAGSVVLVAVDDDTVARWGPPPYGWDRLGPLVTAIRKGRPVVVALVEPGQRLARGGETPPAELGAAIYSRQLLVPAPAGGSAQPVLDVGGPVDRVPLDGTLDGEIVEHSGLHASDPASLPVSTLAGDRLPQVSAARVVADLPPATFAGKIVLVGITGSSASPLLPSPIGALAPAQVHAHALLGLTDGVAWRVAGPGAGWILAILAAGLALWFLPRLDDARGLAFAGGAVLLLGIVDATLCARGTLLLGASRPALAVGLAALTAGFVERRTVRAGLEDAARRLRATAGAAEDDAGFWRRVAELARLYLDCRSSIVAELPPERWHLSLRVLVGTSLGEIHEQRRDVRRGAYREAAVSLNPVWQDDFMSEKLAQRTLLVPLVFDGRLLGFWMLNFAVDAELGAAHLRLVQTLAHQVALAVDRRQSGARAAEEPDALAELAADVRRLAIEEKSASRLVDELPAGVLLATLWGEIRSANATMRRLLAEAGAERFPSLSLADAVLLLAGVGKDHVYQKLQELVRGQGELTIPADTLELRLRWLVREGTRPDGDDAEKLLLLCALPRAAAAADLERTTHHPRPATPVPAPPLHVPTDAGAGATQAIRTVLEALHLQAEDPTTAHVKLDSDETRARPKSPA